MKANLQKTMLLYGRVSVLERLRVNPATVKKVLLQDNISLPEIEKETCRNNIPLERLSGHQLSKIKPAKDLQAVVAKVDKYKYASFDDLLVKAQRKEISLILLDRINDPHNLGAIIRTAACFGGFGIIIPQFNACGVTEAVLHVSSGGDNYVPVAMTSSLSTAILQAKECGCFVAGAQAQGDSMDIDKVSFSFPVVLVLGSEGEGIRYGIQKHLDISVGIPMKGEPLSLNVSVACAIFCHEISKQRCTKP